MNAADHIPFLVFLGFALVSITFAIFATRLELSPGKFRAMESPMQFTLTHHKKVPLKEYLQYMENMLASNSVLYENMSLDAYFLSRVISRKSRLLGYAYFLFLAGLVLGVLLFVAINIF